MLKLGKACPGWPSEKLQKKLRLWVGAAESVRVATPREDSFEMQIGKPVRDLDGEPATVLPGAPRKEMGQVGEAAF